MPPGNELNNREWATLVWLGVGAVFLLWRTDTRTLVGSAVRTAAHLALLIPATLMWAWTALVVFVAYRLRLWAPDLIKDTVIWSIGPAVGLFFSVTNISKDPRFFRRAALSTIKYSVLIEFYVNLRVFNFPVELLVQTSTARENGVRLKKAPERHGGHGRCPACSSPVRSTSEAG